MLLSGVILYLCLEKEWNGRTPVSGVCLPVCFVWPGTKPPPLFPALPPTEVAADSGALHLFVHALDDSMMSPSFSAGWRGYAP